MFTDLQKKREITKSIDVSNDPGRNNPRTQLQTRKDLFIGKCYERKLVFPPREETLTLSREVRYRELVQKGGIGLEPLGPVRPSPISEHTKGSPMKFLSKSIFVNPPLILPHI